MPWLAIAAVGLVSGIIQSGAQDRATQAQDRAAREAMDLNGSMYNTTRADLAPFRQFGVDALPGLSAAAEAGRNISATADPGYRQFSVVSNPGNFQFSTSGPNADPSYQWRLDQGLDAVNNSAAARGGFFSGNTMAALNTRAQNEASQEYGNQFQRWGQLFNNYMTQEGFNADLYNQAWNRQFSQNRNTYDQYSGMANMGYGAANAKAGYGQNYANNSGNILMNQGNNAAAGNLNQGNIWGNVITNVANQGMAAWGQAQQNDQINRILEQLGN